MRFLQGWLGLWMFSTNCYIRTSPGSEHRSEVDFLGNIWEVCCGYLNRLQKRAMWPYRGVR